MGHISCWSEKDLARMAKVTPEQIWEWHRAGLLRGEVITSDVTGTTWLRFPLTESVAARALRDGKDPQQARDELFKDRELRWEHTPPRRTRGELNDSLERFRIRNNLPVPDRGPWGDGDPRKEKEVG